MKVFIGLEIHLHVKTRTKMFCRCSADIYVAEPNTHTCPVCLGLPGALPIANLEAIKKTQILGKSLNCSLNTDSRFDRKHYFYPDLPKGYQISQYKKPLCEGGSLLLESGKTINLERIHLEEDTAKSFHEGAKTLIDYNKSGMPLIEIVTTPEFNNADECEDFCKQIQNIIRTLEIGDGDMEKGQMRLEVNISLGSENSDALPDYKVEVKNINSFRFMKKAIEAEIIRQTNLLASGKKVAQENRGYDEATGTTVSQRDKEEAHDYRYFPEPDIPPMSFDGKYFEDLLEEVKQTPTQIYDYYCKLGLNAQSARFFANYENNPIRTVFDTHVSAGLDAVKLSKLLINKADTRNKSLAELKKLLDTPEDTLSDNEALLAIITTVIKKNPNALADYNKGKTNSLEFLVGQIMRESKGKAEVAKARQLLIETIKG